jgi:predicted glycosyltransferase
VIAAARACPDWRWIVAGPVAAPENLPDNVDLRGMVPDTFPYLTGADVVVASAGHNTVMEIAAARARLICLPEPRPFHEQWSKARSLSRLGVALLADNEISGAEWPYLLERAHRLDTDLWTKVNDETGAAKAAGHLQEMAARWC